MPDVKKLFRFNFKGDIAILILVLVLSLLSIFVVYSTDGVRVVTHIEHLLISYVVMFAVYKFDYRLLGSMPRLLFLFALGLLIATIMSKAVRGVTVMGRDLQTFYLICIAMLFYISNYIARKYKGQGELTQSQVWYIFAVVGIVTLGMASLNMSTAIIFFVTCMAIFYVANFKKSYLMILGGMAFIAVFCVAMLVLVNMKSGNEIHIGRMTTFVNRIEFYLTKNNDMHYGDQMVLSRAAIARGTFHPTGPGRGVIKNRLPENNTDYAFASLYEEFGVAVGVLMVLVYLILFYRAREISKRSAGRFGELLSFGIGFWLTCQALVHIGVNCDLMPATGQTLPYVSSGGMSLIVTGIAIGLLLNISKNDADEVARKTTQPRFVGGKRDS